MTITRTRHFRWAIPDFNSDPWHAGWEALVQSMDKTLYGTLIAAGAAIWANDTDYGVGDIAIDPDDGTIWVVAQANTSASAPTTFLSDRAAHVGNWTSLTPDIDASDAADASAVSAAQGAGYAQAAMDAVRRIRREASSTSAAAAAQVAMAFRLVSGIKRDRQATNFGVNQIQGAVAAAQGLVRKANNAIGQVDAKAAGVVASSNSVLAAIKRLRSEITLIVSNARAVIEAQARAVSRDRRSADNSAMQAQTYSGVANANLMRSASDRRRADAAIVTSALTFQSIVSANVMKVASDRRRADAASVTAAQITNAATNASMMASARDRRKAAASAVAAAASAATLTDDQLVLKAAVYN